MKVESSIKENFSTTTVEPIKDTDKVIQAICEWNGITLDAFKESVGDFYLLWRNSDWEPIYADWDNRIINPIGKYLVNTYDWKSVVFEKDNDKFFGTLSVRAETTRYMLGETVIEIPFRIRAENEETWDRIIIFPKTSDIIQRRMRGLYVVNTGWAERQRLEKEIMAKLIELAQVRGWNEIISTQNLIEDLQTALKRSGITLTLENDLINIDLPRRKVRDVAGADREYMAPPLKMQIDFLNKTIRSKGYSSHWFGTPNSWWNPCWWNRDWDIHRCVIDCDIKGLINLIVSWGNGYNSRDTWLSHGWRHPLAKLRDYIWYIYDHRDETETKKEIEEMKKHLWDIKQDLQVDEWLAEGSDMSRFISSLEWNNETAE